MDVIKLIYTPNSVSVILFTSNGKSVVVFCFDIFVVLYCSTGTSCLRIPWIWSGKKRGIAICKKTEVSNSSSWSYCTKFPTHWAQKTASCWCSFRVITCSIVKNIQNDWIPVCPSGCVHSSRRHAANGSGRTYWILKVLLGCTASVFNT